MPFTESLRTTVLLCAGAATALGAVTIAGASAADEGGLLVPIVVGWWLLAVLVGGFLGRRRSSTPPIARLLAAAKPASTLPEQRPTATMVNRLWPLLISSVAAGGLAFAAPQIPGIATGFAIIWALGWRRQAGAVAAIEQRDGVRFYVERTSPVRPMRLVRTPGFKAAVPRLDGGREG